MIYFRQHMCPVSGCTNRVVYSRPDIKYLSYIFIFRTLCIDDPLQYCVFIMIER